MSVTSCHWLFPSSNPTQPTGDSMKWAQDWKMEVRLEHLPKNRLPSAHTVIALHHNSTEGFKRLQLRNRCSFWGGSRSQRRGQSCSDRKVKCTTWAPQDRPKNCLCFNTKRDVWNGLDKTWLLEIHITWNDGTGHEPRANLSGGCLRQSTFSSRLRYIASTIWWPLSQMQPETQDLKCQASQNDVAA